MAIERVEACDYFVFKGKFTADFCLGVNVLIGDNGTGKSTLIRNMYWDTDVIKQLYNPQEHDSSPTTIGSRGWGSSLDVIFINISEKTKGLYIPEKDILEHAKGLLTFIEQKQTGFSSIYKDVLIAAQDIPTQEQSAMQKSIGEKITAIIGGTIEWDKSDGSYYTIKTDSNRIPFANEASGYKKFGFLGLLISSGQLKPGSILFWDEPENSLNPALVPKLVEILLELAQNDIQIFIATHDYNLARYFDVRKDKSIPVLFHNLSKNGEGGIVCHSSPEYMKLPDNLMEKASEELFEAVVSDAMGVRNDE